MKAPAIYCWTEPVDDTMIAVHARCYLISRGTLYGLTVMALVERIKVHYGYEVQRIGEDRLKAEIASEHKGHLPHIGYVGQWPFEEIKFDLEGGVTQSGLRYYHR